MYSKDQGGKHKMATMRNAKKWQVSLAFSLGLVLLVCLAGMALAQEPGDAALTSPEGGSPTETFAYQGYLEENGLPANGIYDFRFSVWDQPSLGSQVGDVMEFDSYIEVVDGVFTAYLYPAPANQVFTGDARWLQIEVRPGDSVGLYTNLGRQPIVPAPYAWSLRPFGLISGDTGSNGGFGDAVLNVDNTRDYGPGSSSAIYARATTGSALHGESGGVGVYGYSSSTYGVAGYSSQGTAGHFSSSGGYGVYAETLGGDHWDHGGYFSANMGYGVYGTSVHNYGVRGEGYFGVRGEGQQTGVTGWSSSSNGTGVYGSNNGGVGVIGSSVSGTGVKGSSGTGIGMLGVLSGYDAGDLGTWWAPGGAFGGDNGVIGLTKKGGGVGVVGWDISTNGGWAGTFVSTNGGGVWISVPTGQTGLTVSSGTKNAVVDAGDGSRLLYSEEATEVWFSDYGFGQLEGELAVVPIDAIYARTVNLEEPYHVFVQVYGDADVYVSNRTSKQFEVHLREGEPNVEFSYRIVAKRLGYEDDRLERAPWADTDPNLYPELGQEASFQQGTAPTPGGQP
jgi:hypothetical protein